MVKWKRKTKGPSSFESKENYMECILYKVFAQTTYHYNVIHIYFAVSFPTVVTKVFTFQVSPHSLHCALLIIKERNHSPEHHFHPSSLVRWLWFSSIISKCSVFDCGWCDHEMLLVICNCFEENFPFPIPFINVISNTRLSFHKTILVKKKQLGGTNEKFTTSLRRKHKSAT